MRPRSRPLVAVAASVAVLGASLLPWLRTGATSRTGFELARSLRDAGLTDARLVRPLVAAWFLMPLAVAAAWTALAFGRPRGAGILAFVAGLVGLATGIAVLASPGRAEIGPYLAIAGGVVTIAGVTRAGRAGSEHARRAGSPPE